MIFDEPLWPCFQDLEQDAAMHWIGVAVHCTLWAANVRQNPMQLAMLVWEKPELCCPRRKACAAKLLRGSLEIVDATTRKISRLFHRELQGPCGKDGREACR